MLRAMVVLLDGGMGQELQRRLPGPAHPGWSAQVLLERPDLVEEVHRDFLEAGATVLTVSSYAATPERLAALDLEDRFGVLQAEAVARADRARGDRDARIAGCLPPLVASYRPDLAPPEPAARDSYARIVEAQAPRVDLFLCETVSSVAEGRAAVSAARGSGRPVWVAFTLADEPVPETPRLRSGERLEDAVAAMDDLGVDVVLLNCSRPEAVDPALPDIARGERTVGAYANGFTSVAALAPGVTVDALEARVDLDPAAYAERARAWVEAGAGVVGGCCEVGPAHIAEMRRVLLEAGYRVAPPAASARR
jgi:S-methylmethionine-dependent homocysteine/selenocysteine methylase